MKLRGPDKKKRDTSNYKIAAERRWGNRVEVFWSRVKKGDGDACWNYIGHRNKLGYGRQRFNTKNMMAYRISWELVNGPVPKGKQLNHKCNNPSCVRPDHLYAGTQKDNMRDVAATGIKRDSVSGQNSVLAKLKNEDVFEIRKMIKSGVAICQIGRIFSVHETTIHAIDKGRTWTHI